MRPANERRRYNVTSSLIGWTYRQNDPYNTVIYLSNTHSKIDTREVTGLSSNMIDSSYISYSFSVCNVAFYCAITRPDNIYV